MDVKEGMAADARAILAMELPAATAEAEEVDMEAEVVMHTLAQETAPKAIAQMARERVVIGGRRRKLTGTSPPDSSRRSNSHRTGANRGLQSCQRLLPWA